MGNRDCSAGDNVASEIEFAGNRCVAYMNDERNFQALLAAIDSKIDSKMRVRHAATIRALSQ